MSLLYRLENPRPHFSLWRSTHVALTRRSPIAQSQLTHHDVPHPATTNVEFLITSNPLK